MAFDTIFWGFVVAFSTLVVLVAAHIVAIWKKFSTDSNYRKLLKKHVGEDINFLKLLAKELDKIMDKTLLTGYDVLSLGYIDLVLERGISRKKEVSSLVRSKIRLQILQSALNQYRTALANFREGRSRGEVINSHTDLLKETVLWVLKELNVLSDELNKKSVIREISGKLYRRSHRWLTGKFKK